MKKMLMTAAALIALCGTAQAVQPTGQEWVRACTVAMGVYGGLNNAKARVTLEQARDYGWCTGVTLGVADTLNTVTDIWSHLESKKTNDKVCMPMTEVKILIEIGMKWFKDNPKAKTKKVSDGLVDAFVDAFECAGEKT